MNRQSLSFVVTFLVAAGAVVPLVYAGRPLVALAAGFSGLLLHWIASRGGDRDGEVADSSYFFGFLLTLVFLAVGVYRIGVQSDAGGAVNILGFLEDLAAGLMLTIAGLLIRQVRTLGGTRAPAEEHSPIDVQRQLAENLRAMTELWRARPEHQVLDVLNESRSAAREATEQLDRSIAAAGRRMLESVEQLDQATTSATQSMTRAASGVSSSMSDMAQRLEVDIQQSIVSVQRAVTDVVSTLDQQRTLWQSSLEHARTSLDQAHGGLDEHYRRGLEGFAQSSAAFTELAERTTAYVQALPNPAERLAGLWDGVRQLETDLTEAIAGAVLELGALHERAQQLAGGLEHLGGSAERAATAIGSGGDRLGSTLQHELMQMNTIIEEYVRVLEGTQRSLKVRA